ncbi:GNAT family N-acetyltransferase [Aquabacterium sp.]|uniref:GNAT family N-acetyltransferase n=1 Tax=Aquabacterium sp. TaxID=1872578 RepID=UPI002B7BBCA9|nr:GNAT family N-acetyltransferase [Aquabacterium sp.]HSW06405.1 GNAT family N-acetyltransferase [Aquabacterium sp.]
MLSLAPLDLDSLPALQAISDATAASRPPMALRTLLTDAARGGGRQVVVAWQESRPVGCLAWVSLGIAEDGRLYGSPLIAPDAEVAAALIERLVIEGHTLGASHLRVSTWAGDEGKAQALAALGFECLFEWVNFGRPLPLPVAPPQASAISRCSTVDFERIDWAQAARLSAECFRDVPNSPAVTAEILAADWAEADRDASCLLQDDAGAYAAYIVVQHDGTVDAVGVQAAWRGQGLTDTLYARAAAALVAKGVMQMSALVASTNTASMRLHQRLGFTETVPRGAVWERALA